MGTPSDLLTSILNGMSEKPLSKEGQAELIQLHVRDYLRQKFSAAILKASSDAKLESAIWELADKIGGIRQDRKAGE